MRTRFFLVSGVGLAVLVIVLMAFVINVDPGHVGVRINKCSGGGIDETPLGIGYHWQGPCTDITKYPTYQQTMVLARASAEGSQQDDSITVTSSEGLPINVDVSMSFTLEEARVPDAVTQAINAKVAMIQEAQKAEQEVRKTEALAKQKVAAAEGDATARKLRADAEAYANDRVAKSLTPALVEYTKIQKWDGKLPEVTGGNTPLINLQK
jgi:regulator of protease activity HflC (stomatin/prohibitin superfamily)